MGISLLAAGWVFADITKAPSGTLSIPKPLLFTNAIIGNAAPGLEIKKISEIALAPPGVYRTKPYTCLVMVPGPMHDDVSVHPQSSRTPSIRIFRPELRTVPLTETNK